MSFKKDRNHDKKKDKHIKVDVWQSAKAKTGQGGNAFAINASDVGVVKSKVTNVKKKTINVKKKINVKKVIIVKKKRHR